MRKRTHAISFVTTKAYFEELERRGVGRDLSANQMAREVVESALNDDQARVLDGLNLLSLQLGRVLEDLGQMREEVADEMRDQRDSLNDLIPLLRKFIQAKTSPGK